MAGEVIPTPEEIEKAKQALLSMAQGATAAAQNLSAPAPAVEVKFPTTAKVALGILTASIALLAINTWRHKK